MKLCHIADLHLGKRVNGFSMLEDQRYILHEILTILEEEKPTALLIAGDVYDRPIPPEEAVELFDAFLVALSKLGIEALLISGNHDSAERVAFGGRLMGKAGIHPAPVYNGTIAPVTLLDEYGPVDFWPIPFLKPLHVRRFFPEDTIESYTDAMEKVVSNLPLDRTRRSVALVHQFITGGAVCDSEEHSVGGTDEVSVSVLESFDYVALGHLHGPQKIRRETIRYAGSPLKYSFSEVTQKKSVTIAELGKKGEEIAIRTVPLTPLRDMKRITGFFEELMQEAGEDYYEITLLDEEDVPFALSRLRTRYPNLMTLRYDNTRTRKESAVLASEDGERKSPMTLFGELYEMQNNRPMDEVQKTYLESIMEEIWGVTK